MVFLLSYSWCLTVYLEWRVICKDIISVVYLVYGDDYFCLVSRFCKIQNYVVAFVPSSEPLTGIRWIAVQSGDKRSTKFPKKGKPRESKKGLYFMSNVSAASWKGKCKRKHLYSGRQWQLAVKWNHPFSELSEE